LIFHYLGCYTGIVASGWTVFRRFVERRQREAKELLRTPEMLSDRRVESLKNSFMSQAKKENTINQGGRKE